MNLFLSRGASWLAAAVLLSSGFSLRAAGPLDNLITFDPANGSIQELKSAPAGPSILHSGEFGLWQVRFQDGQILNATSPDQRFQRAANAQTGGVRMTYESAKLRVVVDANPVAGGVEFQAQVTPRQGVVLDFACPARLRFPASEVNRLVCPASGNESVGTAFRRKFFEPYAGDQPAGWQTDPGKGGGYQKLLGGGPVMRPVQDEPVGLLVTKDGRDWLGTAAAAIEKAKAVVNRPPAAGQMDLVLVDSANGPYFAARRLGNTGRLWRVSGMVRDEDTELVQNLVAGVMDRLVQKPAPGRSRIGLIALVRGPERGNWAAVKIADWAARLQRLPAVKAGKVEFVRLETLPELDAALRDTTFAAVLNPYGEAFPVARGADFAAAIDRAEKYIRGGGNWFEVGGYSFFMPLRPRRFQDEYHVSYPSAFADFLHLDTRAGTAALYRVQPRTWEPWQAQKDHAARFVPGARLRRRRAGRLVRAQLQHVRRPGSDLAGARRPAHGGIVRGRRSADLRPRQWPDPAPGGQAFARAARTASQRGAGFSRRQRP